MKIDPILEAAKKNIQEFLNIPSKYNHYVKNSILYVIEIRLAFSPTKIYTCPTNLQKRVLTNDNKKQEKDIRAYIQNYKTKHMKR